jgi:predicted transcriptional regulator
MDHEMLLTQAADVVAAHVSHNHVALSDVPVLIRSVYDALAALGAPAEPPTQALVPAVSIRSSVKPETIACLECGKKMQTLKRHLRVSHDLSPAAYVARWNLPADYPLVAQNYTAVRKALALKIGLGRKPGQSPAKPTAARKRLGLAEA